MKTSIRKVVVPAVARSSAPINDEALPVGTSSLTPPAQPVFNWKQEIVEDSASGTEDTYSLIKTPVHNSVVIIFIDGILQRQTVDYNISGKILTFDENIPSGSNIVAFYNARR